MLSDTSVANLLKSEKIVYWPDISADVKEHGPNLKVFRWRAFDNEGFAFGYLGYSEDAEFKKYVTPEMKSALDEVFNKSEIVEHHCGYRIAMYLSAFPGVMIITLISGILECLLNHSHQVVQVIDHLIPKMEAYNKESTNMKVCLTFKRAEGCHRFSSPANIMGDYGERLFLTIAFLDATEAKADVESLVMEREAEKKKVEEEQAAKQVQLAAARAAEQDAVFKRQVEADINRSIKDKDIYSWSKNVVQLWLIDNGMPSSVCGKLEGFDGKMLAEVTDSDLKDELGVTDFVSRKKLLALIGEAKRVCAERAASAQVNALTAASQKLASSSSNVRYEYFFGRSTVFVDIYIAITHVIH